jgi:uncharacterized protein
VKTKFFYLHGFNSAVDESSDKFQLLKTLGETVPLNYDSFDTYGNIIKSLVGRIEMDFMLVFVGTSLGGYYAAELGKIFDSPCVMINPALNPGECLEPLVGQTFENYQTGVVNTLSKETVDSYRGMEFSKDRYRYYTPLVLLDSGDELLDSKKTSQEMSGYDVVCFNGGNHRFEHMVESLPFISNYVDTCSYICEYE